MRLHFDQDADALYLRLDNSTIIESEEVKPCIVLDVDERGQIVGIEVLRIQERVNTGSHRVSG